tara:strand:- start:621 stop:1076 length:456 start_codon:yes stop_codon:yes gene_type:complete
MSSSFNIQSGARDRDHFGVFNFRIELEGIDVGGFQSVDGLEVTIDPIEYHISNERMARKRPGRPKLGNLTFTKGYVNTDTLWRWCEEIMNGKVIRKSGSIVLLDDTGMNELCRYNFFEAWPAKWSGFKLDGKSNDASVETLELAIERLERV